MLRTFRIPYGRGASRGAQRGPPVLLIHGISLSSTCWVVNGYEESLAFILADEGARCVAPGGGGGAEPSTWPQLTSHNRLNNGRADHWSGWWSKMQSVRA